MTARFEKDVNASGAGESYRIVEADEFRVGRTETGVKIVWAVHGDPKAGQSENGYPIDGDIAHRCFIMNRDGKTIASEHWYPPSKGQTS